MLGLRGNPEYWGTVYDSVTKQPIDPALVKLVEATTGTVVGTCTTDLFGHYSFLIYPGKFKMLVQRTNYVFPSKTLTGDRDGIYTNLYHGEFFEVSGDTDILNLNIPMDPVRPDWNQQAKGVVAKTHPQMSRAATALAASFFWLGLAVAGGVFYFYRTPWLLFVLAGYGAMFVLLWLVPKVRLWGRVVIPPSVNYLNLQVQLAHAELPDILMGKSLVFPDGKFYLRAPKGKYIVTVADLGTPAKRILTSKQITVGWEGIVNQTMRLDTA